jgi:CheY-like chemotaxis protein
VDLPLVDGKQHPAEIVTRPRPSDLFTTPDAEPDLTGFWVVIIDDEEDARDMLKVVLQQWGARVTALATVAEVIDALAGEPGGRVPDVLIADIAMPEEDGFDLIRKVRKLERERGGAIPAIALTAYAAAEDRLKALSAGYQRHVAKPVSMVELGTVVERLARNDKNS